MKSVPAIIQALLLLLVVVSSTRVSQRNGSQDIIDRSIRRLADDKAPAGTVEGSKDKTSCGLNCVNGGECRIGRTGDGVDQSSVDKSGTGNKQGHYCFCQTGYTGIYCEIKFVLCESAADSCFNGERCKRDVDDRGKEYHHCECDTDPAVSNLASSFAGRFCQRSSIIYCDDNKRDDAAMFCANSGACNHDKKSCRCPPQWTGQNCQIPLNLKELYEAESLLSPPNEQGEQEGQEQTTENETKGNVAYVSLIIIIGTFVSAMIVARHYDVEFRYGRIQQRESPRVAERRQQKRRYHYQTETEMSHIETRGGRSGLGTNEVL
jgi:hypothetical protein